MVILFHHTDLGDDFFFINGPGWWGNDQMQMAVFLMIDDTDYRSGKCLTWLIDSNNPGFDIIAVLHGDLLLYITAVACHFSITS